MMLHIGALATDFRASSMGMRDKLYLEKDRLREFLDAIPRDAALYEIVALCTCNRIEIFYVCDNHDIAADRLSLFLANYHKIPLPRLKNALTNYRCEDAVRHLFRVASGIESMVFGEHEILGQIRDAYFLCFKKKTTDSCLNRLFQQAIATGKQVRSCTAVGFGALSIVSIAAERMEEMAGDLKNKRILIVGVGAIGLRSLKRLAAANPDKLGLSNRTDERAAQFCRSFHAEHVPFNDIVKKLNEYDIILLATASERYILKVVDIARQRDFQNIPLLVVDLGAPRNADPAIGALKNVTLVCIDDLRQTAENRLNERKNELAEVDNIIEQQVKEFTRWYRYRSGCECNQD